MPSSAPLIRPLAAYLLEGTVLEARHGGRLGPGPEACPSRSVSAWIVERGMVAGVDVSGLVVLSVSERRSSTDSLRRLVLVEERATPQQARALLDLTEGRLGGSLAAYASPVDENLGVYQVPVEWELGADRSAVRVPGHLELVVLAGSSTMAVDIPEYDLGWRVDGGDALRGEIHVAGGVPEAAEQ